MHRVSKPAVLAGTLLAGLAAGAHAQTVTSTNGSYSVTFTETTTGGGASPFLYTYNATLNSPANGAFINGLAFTFANPNAIIPFTANSNSFTAVNQSGNSIMFAVTPADPVAGIPADPGMSAANPTASFTFLSSFAPTTLPNALAITPSGGNSAGPGPGIGNLFVGPSGSPAAPPAPEPGAWTALGVGALGLVGLTARARRAAARS